MGERVRHVAGARRPIPLCVASHSKHPAHVTVRRVLSGGRYLVSAVAPSMTTRSVSLVPAGC